MNSFTMRFLCRIAKPYFYHCKVFELLSHDTHFAFSENPQQFFKVALAAAGASTQMCSHALCVFLCTPSSNRHEKFHSRASSVKEKSKNILIITLKRRAELRWARLG